MGGSNRFETIRKPLLSRRFCQSGTSPTPRAGAGAKGGTIMNNEQLRHPLCVVTYSGQWVRLGVQGKWPRRARVQPARVRPPFQESDHAYRVEQKNLLSSVTHILSGLMGRALAALG